MVKHVLLDFRKLGGGFGWSRAPGLHRPRRTSVCDAAVSSRNRVFTVRCGGLCGHWVVARLQWGAATSEERGPVLATNTNKGMRNAIGAHSGSYSIYRALAVAAGALDPVRVGSYRAWALWLCTSCGSSPVNGVANFGCVGLGPDRQGFCDAVPCRRTVRISP